MTPRSPMSRLRRPESEMNLAIMLLPTLRSATEERQENNYAETWIDTQRKDPVTGLTGLVANGIPMSQRHKIIDIPDKAKEEIIKLKLSKFISINNLINFRKSTVLEWEIIIHS